jgi:hypothetical protein
VRNVETEVPGADLCAFDEVFKTEVFQKQDAGGGRPEDGPNPRTLGFSDVDRAVGTDIDVPHRGWVTSSLELRVGRTVVETVARIRAGKASQPGAESDARRLRDEHQISCAAKWCRARTTNQRRNCTRALISGVGVAGNDPTRRQWRRHPQWDLGVRSHVLDALRPGLLRGRLQRMHWAVLDAIPVARPNPGWMDCAAATRASRLVLHTFDRGPLRMHRQEIGVDQGQIAPNGLTRRPSLGFGGA